ncbi:MAG: GTPase [Pseudomonadota bacterium]
MLDFILLLKSRYRSVLTHIGDDAPQTSGFRESLNSLTLAEAFLKKGRINRQRPDHPIQIAVIGPTQAGKSSVVNLLLQGDFAGVSPLAGYTAHPHGFCLNIDVAQCDWLNDYFDTYERRTQTELPRDRHDCYALATAGNGDVSLPASIIWDTPDFDSIDAEGYRDSVLRTAALADVLLLVISRDKYADQSVWDMMALLEPLNQPTVVLLNKVTDESRDLVVESLRQKWRDARSDKPPALTTFSYRREGAMAEFFRGELAGLYKQLKNAAGKNSRRKQARFEQALLKTHWGAWIAPLAAEHNALDQWSKLVEIHVEDALAVYRRDYLNHPQHYETFQRAIAELLTLLEIPGLAAVLVQARKIITWPMRQIFGIGKSSGGRGLADTSSEVNILIQVAEHLMIQLSEAVLDKCDEAPEQEQWWKEVGGQLRVEKRQLAEAFQEAARQYHADFQPEIEETARRLYEKLQEQPAALNSLRATRVTTDAAAVALALKTGGIGLHDLIITPAMLSLTSLLAEGALGGYMSRVEAELKQRQFGRVEQRLFHGVLENVLRRLPEKIKGADKFNIPLESVKAAEAALKETRHGLRLL